MLTEPLRVGIIGMGGYAGIHHDAIACLEATGVYRLICACDPDIDAFAERRQTLRFPERQVQVFADYLEMLDACGSSLDLVTIPTPIPLHAPMHRACVERGLAVYLEKPPTLDYAELERMIAVDAGARYLTVVGFNFIVEPERQSLKRRMVAGEFGPLRRVSAYARWPRNASYFTRAGWAGRLRLNGSLVLDSCIGNAMAHQVHNALFWCGTDRQWAWGELTEVAAELYRAHAIEGMDTAFIRSTTHQHVDLLVAMTHACDGASTQEERVECEHAVITYHIYNSGPDRRLYTITWSDGRVETGDSGHRNLVADNFQAYADYLCGRRDRPQTRLEDCRPFVQINDLAYIAAGRISTIPETSLTLGAEGFRHIHGICDSIDRFISTGEFPSAQGQPWAQPGGTAIPADLPRLNAVIAALAEARAAECAGQSTSFA